MALANLSASSQNYLKVAWALQEWSDEPVTTSELAARVGVRLSTASDAIKRLAERGYFDHNRYGAVSLTERGRQYAIEMVRRHRLIEAFLVEVLDYRWDEVHDEAEVLEHAVSDLLIERIDRHLGHPERDPHGDPIPGADGTFERPAAIQLAQLAPDQKGRIERIADDDPELLQFFAERGLVYGAEIVIDEAAPYSEAIMVTTQTGQQPVPLGSSAAAAIWVAPLD